jgi:hypothetical protein
MTCQYQRNSNFGTQFRIIFNLVAFSVYLRKYAKFCGNGAEMVMTKYRFTTHAQSVHVSHPSRDFRVGFLREPTGEG